MTQRYRRLLNPQVAGTVSSAPVMFTVGGTYPPGPGSSGVLVPTGPQPGGVWTFPDTWGTLVESTPGPCALLGFTFRGGTFVGESEFQLAVGAAGAEQDIGLVHLVTPNSGVGGLTTYYLPIPIRVDDHQRISIRGRGGIGGGAPYVELIYAGGFDTDDFSYFTRSKLTSMPIGTRFVPGVGNVSGGYSLTPHPDKWGNSEWVEFLTGLETEEAAIVGLTTSNAYAPADIEFDIGFGEATHEITMTTLRGASNAGGGRLQFLHLPGALPVEIGERVSVRMRLSIIGGGAQPPATTKCAVTLLYYTDLANDGPPIWPPVEPPTPPIPTPPIPTPPIPTPPIPTPPPPNPAGPSGWGGAGRGLDVCNDKVGAYAPWAR